MPAQSSALNNRARRQLIRALPTGPRLPGQQGAAAVTVGECAKSSRCGRTQDAFDAVHTVDTGTFAGQVADNLERSGKLAVLPPRPVTPALS